MQKRHPLISLLFSLLLINVSFAQNPREIAITIDDLPFVGENKNAHLEMIINTIKANDIPVTGFVIASEVGASNWPMLHKFREAGLELGNHTLTHLNLNRVNSDTYIQEIEAADKILLPVLTSPKYFRYPYLAMSHGRKKEQVLRYLASKNYQIAPVTIDSKDFMFNQLLLAVPQNERRHFMEVLKPCYLNFIWQQTLKAQENSRSSHNAQAQILLIHANLLNAYVLPDIINLYKQNGFAFVRLSDALQLEKSEKKITEIAHSKPTYDPQIETYMAWD